MIINKETCFFGVNQFSDKAICRWLFRHWMWVFSIGYLEIQSAKKKPRDRGLSHGLTISATQFTANGQKILEQPKIHHDSPARPWSIHGVSISACFFQHDIFLWDFSIKTGDPKWSENDDGAWGRGWLQCERGESDALFVAGEGEMWFGKCISLLPKVLMNQSPASLSSSLLWVPGISWKPFIVIHYPL